MPQQTTMETLNHIQILPVGPLFHVISFLDVSSLQTFDSTCKSIRTAISKEWESREARLAENITVGGAPEPPSKLYIHDSSSDLSARERVLLFTNMDKYCETWEEKSWLSNCIDETDLIVDLMNRDIRNQTSNTKAFFIRISSFSPREKHLGSWFVRFPRSFPDYDDGYACKLDLRGRLGGRKSFGIPNHFTLTVADVDLVTKIPRILVASAQITFSCLEVESTIPKSQYWAGWHGWLQSTNLIDHSGYRREGFLEICQFQQEARPSNTSNDNSRFQWDLYELNRLTLWDEKNDS